MGGRRTRKDLGPKLKKVLEQQPCAACERPDEVTRHTCGLEDLQNMLRFR